MEMNLESNKREVTHYTGIEMPDVSRQYDTYNVLKRHTEFCVEKNLSGKYIGERHFWTDMCKEVHCCLTSAVRLPMRAGEAQRTFSMSFM